MLVAAAVCPCPPLLVPEVAAGAAPELDGARTACSDALGVLAASRPGLLVVLGPAEQSGSGTHPEGTRGSFSGFGVDVDVRLGARQGAEPERVLPPSLAVAAWLLERTGWSDAPIEGLGVGEPLAPERCIQVGRDLAARAERVALLVMGDASACRTLKAPGYLDERAAAFDVGLRAALTSCDVNGLDLGLGESLLASLDGIRRLPEVLTAGARVQVDYDDDPFGVQYWVMRWKSG